MTCIRNGHTGECLNPLNDKERGDFLRNCGRLSLPILLTLDMHRGRLHSFQLS
jgi:hypothetical protein